MPFNFQLILGDANINSAGKVGGDGLADLLVSQVRTSMIIHDILQEQVSFNNCNLDKSIKYSTTFFFFYPLYPTKFESPF